MWAISTSHSAAAASLAATKRSRGALDCCDGVNGVPGSVPLEHEPGHRRCRRPRTIPRAHPRRSLRRRAAGVVAMLPCGDDRHPAGAAVDGGSGRAAPRERERRRGGGRRGAVGRRRRRRRSAPAARPRRRSRARRRPHPVVGRRLSAESHPRRACVGPAARVAATRGGRRRRPRVSRPSTPAVGGGVAPERPVDRLTSQSLACGARRRRRRRRWRGRARRARQAERVSGRASRRARRRGPRRRSQPGRPRRTGCTAAAAAAAAAAISRPRRPRNQSAHPSPTSALRVAGRAAQRAATRRA